MLILQLTPMDVFMLEWNTDTNSHMNNNKSQVLCGTSTDAVKLKGTMGQLSYSS